MLLIHLTGLGNVENDHLCLGLDIVDGGNERDNLTYDRVLVQILSYVFQA